MVTIKPTVDSVAIEKKWGLHKALITLSFRLSKISAKLPSENQQSL